ncbi:amino acid ABC transporter substrate-binding protein [Vineibacter terrae]|uniref:Amino acid ABC transporter substrate-binding protein n=1 Tax=Vineibacter terrae TaxID=2586908 RepID=A0A5C8PCR9_9HYPH|nr:amino acid ABC transporter substrate-binding protein [Vineibacter terrae]TXL71105.1 amino acid ABC transporter substrate-binding protein [Vineibacter terrae]
MRGLVGSGRGSWLAVLLLAVATLWSGAAMAGVLDQIRSSKTIRIAYREDAPPFSYKGSDGQPAGFMVDLCRKVAQRIGKQLDVADVKVVYVPVTGTNRIEAVSQARADMLCEATSVTLARRQQVDFSLMTFVDGASLMIRAGGPDDLKAMAGRKVGVLAGTTTEAALRNTLKRDGTNAEVVPLQTHRDGVAQLDDEKIVAYFADRSILMYLAPQSKAPGQLQIANEYLTVEPYALALPRGDTEFRLAVDRALSQIYRSGEIFALLRSVFGAEVKPSEILQALYVVSGLPD